MHSEKNTSAMLYHLRINRSLWNSLWSFFSTAAVFIVVLGLTACDSGGGGPEPEEDTIVADETVVVDSSDASLQSIDESTLTFQLTGSAPDFQEGDVVVGAENGGFLRRVTSVETEGSQVTLGTEQASLVEAVKKGEASTSFNLSNAQREKGKGGAPDDLEWKAVRTAKGVEPKENTLGIELANAEITDGDQAAMEIVFKNGEAEYDPSVDFDLEIADEEVDRLNIATSGTANFSTDVEVVATNTMEAGNKKSLARFRTSPIVFFIGPVPVTIQPVVDFFAGYEAQIQQTGSIQTGIESSNTVTLGAEYANSSWSPIAEREKSISPRPFDWNVELSGEAKGYVRPELTLKVYQAAGPLVNTGPYVRADASVGSDSWEWGLYGGLDASFGGEVEIFSFALARYDHTFSLAEAEIATDSGDRADEATINGEAITPEGEALPDMNVSLSGDAQNYSVTTDENGEFSQEVEPGTYEIDGNAVEGTTYLSVNGQQTSVSVEKGQTASTTLDTKDGYYLGLREVTLGGDQGTVTASPGESVDLSFDYTAWSRSELSTAIVYAAAGIEENGRAAADLGIPGSNPGEDGSADITLTAPSETGTYTVYVFEAPQTSESDALSQYEDEFPNEYKFIPVATLEVE